MTYDISAIAKEFPLLAETGGSLHYLDNAAMSQIHQIALDSQFRFETTLRSNVNRGSYRLAETATSAYAQARDQVARFLNAKSANEIIFTSGTTAAINLVANSFGEHLSLGDEIVISAAEHHSNFVPWQRLCQRNGLLLRILPVTTDGFIDMQMLSNVVTQRCRLIALTHASNVTGIVTDVSSVIEFAHAVGAVVLLDGAQRVQHGPVDVQKLNADFYVFSGHKCFSSGGIGVLWGRSDLLNIMPPFMFGGGMVAHASTMHTKFSEIPFRFEAGTPPIAQAIGLGAVLNWMSHLPWAKINEHEAELAKRLISGLLNIPKLRLIGPENTNSRLPIISFEIEGVHPHDICQILDRYGVALRGGHHCAQPLMTSLRTRGATRASIALYNTTNDVDVMLTGLQEAVAVLT